MSIRKNNSDTPKRKNGNNGNTRHRAPLAQLIAVYSRLDAAAGQLRAIFSDDELLNIAKQEIPACSGYIVDSATKARTRQHILPFNDGPGRPDISEVIRKHEEIENELQSRKTEIELQTGETSEDDLRSKEKKEARQEKILATIREKREAAQAKEAPTKPMRDQRFIQEEREAWEWLVRITNATAVAKKKRGVSDIALAADLASSGKENVANDNVWIGGVHAHVTSDMRAIARKGLRHNCSTNKTGNSKPTKCGGSRNL